MTLYRNIILFTAFCAWVYAGAYFDLLERAH
jgi:hypothetical protein